MRIAIKVADCTATFECNGIALIHSEETAMLSVKPSMKAMADFIKMRLPFETDLDGNYVIEVKYTAITALKY